MARYSLIFFGLAVIATIEFVSGFAVIIIPGWHTEVAPPFVFLSIAIIVWLYLLSISYFILERKKKLFSKIQFFVHLFLTMFYFLYSNGTNSFINVSGGLWKFLVSLGLFGLGQILYVAFSIRAILGTAKKASLG